MKEFSQIGTVGSKAPLFHRINFKYGVNLIQLLAGLFVLAAGTLYYIYFRSPEQTYFLNFLGISSSPNKITSPVLLTIGNSLPTLVHVFAFSVITAGILAKRKWGYALVCLAWFGVDVLFELYQGNAAVIVPFIPSWFSNIFFLENTKEYLLHGHFDYLDLASIAAGSLVAYWFLIKTENKWGATL